MDKTSMTLGYLVGRQIAGQRRKKRNACRLFLQWSYSPGIACVEQGKLSACYNLRMTYLLNILDLLFTLHALRHGARELNPLLQSIPIMIIYKVFVVVILCWWLGKREEKIARYGLKLTALWFGAVDLWHIYHLLMIGGI